MSNIKNLKDFLTWAEALFLKKDLYYGHGTDNAWDEAVMLALAVLQLPPDVSQAVLSRALTEKEAITLRQLALRRVEEKIPVPYLTGEAWFLGERYHIAPGVIIPRSPIAELIQNQFQPWLENKPKHILDLCTGSGCIAIACAKAFPTAKVDAVDIADDPINLAKKNVALHKVKQQVTVYQSDLFSDLTKSHCYDMIISNPPYVNHKDLTSMPTEYHHEPKLALAAGKDGLDIVRKILQQASRFLNKDGLLFVEVGNSQAALVDAYPKLPFTWIEFEQGGHGVFVLPADAL